MTTDVARRRRTTRTATFLPRFSLRWALIFVGVCGCMCCITRVCYVRYKPLDWSAFRLSTVDSLIGQDRIVVAALYHGGSLRSRVSTLSNFENARIRSCVRNEGVVLLEGSSWDSRDVEVLLRRLNLASESLPLVVEFSRSHPKGRVLMTDVTDDDPRFRSRFIETLIDE